MVKVFPVEQVFKCGNLQKEIGNWMFNVFEFCCAGHSEESDTGLSVCVGKSSQTDIAGSAEVAQ
jgi:hypothetical protein